MCKAPASSQEPELSRSVGALALLGLATYRVSRMLLEDEIAAPLRDKVFEKFPPHESKIGYLFTCPWCISVWTGAGLVALEYASPIIGEAAQKVLAASAISGLLDTRL